MAGIERAPNHDETLRRLMTEHEIPIRRMCCMYLRYAPACRFFIFSYCTYL